MRFLYTLSIVFYGFAIRLASLFNDKAKLWVRGRAAWQEELATKLGSRSGWLWMHCASLGEFEQGRPILEAIKKQHPHQLILLTFYSPSGYEVRKNWAGADAIAYLPLDTPRNAAKLVQMVSPIAVIFVKYEFWYNLLFELKHRRIPTLLVSGVFRPDQLFFRSYGKFAQKAMQAFERVFVQDEHSAALVHQLALHVEIAGDSRFDRVLEIVNQEGIDDLAAFCNNARVVMVGSSWQAEEEAMKQFVADPRKLHDVKVVLVPHEVGADKMQRLKQTIPGSVLLSGYDRASSADVLIVDRIGYLSRAYRYCTIAVLGGGFGKGIHNILEAAVYGKPVVFGPKHQKFHEAGGLIEAGGGFSVQDTKRLNDKLISLLGREDALFAAGKAAEEYVRKNAGATQKVMNYLTERQIIRR
ncbi:MAG: 3-deoxy-D-manno-octulosonic acid transferase [Cryomorphaceae bacterium]|nr:3-deoxy-D-manno-octulosonic acid transferase [Cryomorphaceae bacterium]